MKKTTLLFAFINLGISTFSQNVGIGLTTPAAKLQINSTSTSSRPLLLLSDSISGVSNTIEFAKQGIINKWSLASNLQSNNFNSSIRFGFTGGVTPFILTGDGKVGINSINPLASLDVNSPWAQTAIFSGSDRMYISLVEQGNYRGYIGSFSGNPEDVDFGTHSGNPTGKVHLVAGGGEDTPRLTVTPIGNIGIGTQTPAEKLDVNGSINVTQTIKANGVAGQPGQVLSLNSNGNIVWAGVNEFQNHRTFLYQPDQINWTVPAGVTRIMIEGWGAGGGGCITGGGGGGGYVCGWYTVTTGVIVSFQIGSYGAGGVGLNSGEDGESTYINAPGESISASGGEKAFFSGSSGFVGRGGSYGAGLRGIGMPGENGQPTRTEYHQSNATIFLEVTIGGKGGDAGNKLYTGGSGSYRLYNPSTGITTRLSAPVMARQPGGGGSGHYTGGSPGANGLVIIHY
jgi:hypothetical protein